MRRVQRILFRQQTSARVKSLRGFEKHHSMPTKVDERSSAFVVRCAEPELREVRDELYGRIKETFRYKRKDLVTYEDEGVAGITTPHFSFQIRVELDPKSPTSVIWYRELVDIASAAIAERDDFEALFGASFDTIEYEFDAPIDIAALVDDIEDLDNPRLFVQLPPDASYCDVRIDKLGFTVHIEPTTLSIRFGHHASPKDLVTSLEVTRQTLAVDNLGLLPLPR